MSDVRRGLIALQEYRKQQREAKAAPTERKTCPFAAMGGPLPEDHPPAGEQRKIEEPDGKQFDDEKKSEQALCSNESNTSGPACPIRFLDQYSPEDIAKYFEEHKHELPRSHELCVKRFQANAESIRELDAKYGNLVNMIQGLGHKHQPMLVTTASQEPAVSEGAAKGSNQKIQRWAEGVSDEPAQDNAANQDRTSHFDRPLKDVRVGESPSRPWGMPIPSQYLDAAEMVDKAGEERVDGGKTDAHRSEKIKTQVKALQNSQVNADKAEPPTTPESVQATVPESDMRRKPVIVNKGALIMKHDSFCKVAKGSDHSNTIENHGTLIIGWPNHPESEKKLIEKFSAPFD